jgi:DNA mismatch repair protein MutS
MMQQYHDAKAACGDALLLFRMGDFYELFFDDAKTAARVLGLALTSRDKGENAVPMAGFPHHQLEAYLAKLIAAGLRAAICDQVEDPKKAKGLVKREVTRIVTRGTVTDDALLDPQRSNHLAAVTGGDPLGVAWIDVSTGRFEAAVVPHSQFAELIARIEPVEVLFAEGDDAREAALVNGAAISRRPPWAFSAQAALENLGRHFGTRGVEGFGFSVEGNADLPAIRAAGAVLDYLNETQRASLDHVERLVPYRPGNRLEIDPAARRSLELVRTIRDGGREGSLLDVVDQTVTSMGARRIAEWLASPLVDVAQIEARHEAVGEFVADSRLCDSLRELCAGIYDVQRLLSRVSTGRASPRDLAHVARTLAALPKIKARLTGRQSPLLGELEARLDLCEEVRGRLDAALVDDCPLASGEGGIIRPGFHAELDELRSLATGGKQWIAQYQAREIERTGIANLKVGFNKVFGYYLEVTNAHAHKVPDDYIRKQTIKSAERYITPELKEYEEKVVTADERAKELEYELFVELRDALAREVGRIAASADVLAEVDVLAGLAFLARRQGYCRPQMVAEPVLNIVAGRHPVIEALEAAGKFVPNDTALDACADAPRDGAGRVLIITGPNMAGKSTYIRQVALITIMAQLGSFVPAQGATIGVVDRLFARIGASDELSRGQSTFMVEMTETARILNTATRQSLVVLDEIGRGTSTYDGVSLAWSIVEHLHDSVGCRALFATHYHELTDLADSLGGVRNYNVAVREWNDEVIFLHQIVPGAADKSYGIHVARLAGVPRGVQERAREVLAEMEEMHCRTDQGKPSIPPPHRPSQRQLSLFAAEDHPVLDAIRGLDVSGMTPLEALQHLGRWQEQLNRD